MAENTAENSNVTLEGGTYELLRKRILAHVGDLQQKLELLNQERKEVFGTIETKVLSTERITTSNNCVPWDMLSFGNFLLFGYNVHMGLRTEIKITDVFSLYDFKDHQFHEHDISKLLNNKVFLDDFQKLYKYYKDTRFLRFKVVGPFLHMVFRIGKEVTDLKTFKWEIKGDKLVYVDNRSDHEYTFPNQHAFSWKRTKREDFREGLHPHVSIKERVFIECVGGDLTVKIEDNTNAGEGIYQEPVEHKEQSLEDAEFEYADLGTLIVIKARPYQEEERYLLFNEKLHEVVRIDSIKESCVLLPDNQGLIFSDGYYLQSGVFKKFDLGLTEMLFERAIQSINGEDYLYVFYNRKQGIYLLLNYNIISQSVENPIVCHGFTIFENGEMCLFKTETEPRKHHAIQIWQTPYTGPNFQMDIKSKSFLKKIGNKDVVRAMSECHEVVNLILRPEVYSELYIDVIKNTTDILDSYYWLGSQPEFDIATHMKDIREVAESAVDEYDKVRKLQETAGGTLNEIEKEKNKLVKKAKASFNSIDGYVKCLNEIRSLRGKIISAKDMRYVDTEKLDKFNEELAESSDTLSTSCIRFLNQEHALEPYINKVNEFRESIPNIEKAVEAENLMQEGEEIANELNLLIETVSDLKISDATQTTKIIERISEIYGTYNQVKGDIVSKKKDLVSVEAKSEFEATLKLLEQSVSNYLDISDTPDKCDAYLTKVILQIEELEARFGEFDEFLGSIETKREEIYNAFESRKLFLNEKRSKKSAQLHQAAERVLNAIRKKSDTLKDREEVNGYFASDLMVDRVRNIAQQLVELGDSVKSDDITGQLKVIKEDCLRQLRDKEDLFEEGENIIKFGNHHFYTNTLELDLSIINRNDTLCFHLGGTDFFETIDNAELNDLEDVWEQALISENEEVYRAEFLAYSLYQMLQSGENGRTVLTFMELNEEEQMEEIRSVMSKRYQEGYTKGIHEFDAHKILIKLIEISQAAASLRFPTTSRAKAVFFWNSVLDTDKKALIANQIKSAAIINSIFPASNDYEGIIRDLEGEILEAGESVYDHEEARPRIMAEYLFHEISLQDHFSISSGASGLYKAFQLQLEKKHAQTKFKKSLQDVKDQPKLGMRLVRNWLRASIEENGENGYHDFIDEVGTIILFDHYSEAHVKQVNLKTEIEGMKGSHAVISDGKYQFHLNHFTDKLEHYKKHTVTRFLKFQETKKSLVSDFRATLRLDEFKPRVLSSFVRNKLIDKVYFPLIGNNLAKQMGAAGEGKRTDLMGLLLLISPPGYGKTTLMEYIASRLGIIFMKINGPAIGHEVTSLDPADAPNAASAQELTKLNLSFEMGNNVMIYLDDIQHCNPEFLQKFISMCDAQRKIEGVYNGRPKTYDFRGKKVCVVMAGNPYTESGEKFQIPDMLSNRADIYNLGDIIGDTEEEFKLSYIENCLTSNPILSRLASKSINDVYPVLEMVRTKSSEGMDFEVSHTAEELKEYTAVLTHLLKIREVILTVNINYIKSAAVSDEFRVEPSFKLQGSYRDMNKIAERVLPMMNEKEVDTLILSHYENESQTLTSNAEANLLKFKSLVKKDSAEDKKRWKFIIERFMEQQKRKGFGQNAMLVEGIGDIAESLKGILDNIKKK